MEQGVIFRKDKPLKYKEDQFGNRIPDYSTAGFGSGSPLPDVPVAISLEPGNSSEDDTARIQLALDTLAKENPDKRGIRGAVLLKRGTYHISGQLRMQVSGIILRGEGQFEEGTQLRATGRDKRSLIVLSGKDDDQDRVNRSEKTFRYRNEDGSYWEVVDEYAPSGRDYVQVSPVRGLATGDLIVLEQRMNQDWINILGMNDFPPRPDGNPSIPWDPAQFVFQFERTIEKVDGGRVFLNAALVNPVFARFGITQIFKPQLPKRVSLCGVENLRMISDHAQNDNSDDEAHAWVGVEINRARDCWVKGLTTVNFGNTAVSCGEESIFVTVEDCAFLNPVSRFGYGRRHGFLNAGQQVLFQRCYANDCNYPFFIGESSKGPNVFLDCYASGEKAIIGPWKYWSMGTLWDNTQGERLIIRNRGYDGSGWGWSGINHLFWNSTAFESISVQSPINGWNWAIGCRGDRIGAPFQGLVGHVSKHGKAVVPRSIYMKQLKDRQGSSFDETVFGSNQYTGTVLFHVRDTLSEN